MTCDLLRALFSVLALTAGVTTCASAERPLTLQELATISLDDLTKVPVWSLTQREETLFDSPAAVFVLTGDDIRRSGVTTLPEALRLAPGLNVAQINGNNWAISARGFQERFATKMLVLVDGRTIFNPITIGVLWEAHAIPIETIERIEVIRGAASTVWGQNATNGVINIITRSAASDKGASVSTTIGNQEHRVLVRHADRAEDFTYRVYGNVERREAHHPLEASEGANDNRSVGRAGFRIDGIPTKGEEWTIDGEAYGGELGATDVFATLGEADRL